LNGAAGTLPLVKRRLLLLFAILALLAAACGGSAEGELDVAPVTPTAGVEQSPSVTTTPGDTPGATEAPDGATTTTTVASAPPKVVDGPPAPNFTLALADNRGDFVLSDEQKPVFMVFWAEW